GRLNDSQRAAAKPQYHHSRIFGLDFRQRRGALGKYAVDVTHHPLEQIDVMACLVTENPAIERPGAAPWVLIVVGLGSTPPDAHRAEYQTAETPLFQGFPQFHDRNIEAILLNDKQAYADAIAGTDHGVGIVERQG